MTASEARKITDLNLKGQVISPFLTAIYAKVKEAAKVGRSKIINPAICSGCNYPTEEEKKAIYTILRTEGFSITHYTNPDPGYPGSSDYDEMSW